jgi:hypothetical protein
MRLLVFGVACNPRILPSTSQLHLCKNLPNLRHLRANPEALVDCATALALLGTQAARKP